MGYTLAQELRVITSYSIHYTKLYDISRAVYPASEYTTSKWIKENSSVCEITGTDITKITKDQLYRISNKLFSVKEALENHLSHRTNELFDIQDKIVLYDLTNTYFEGRKENSCLAKFGRITSYNVCYTKLLRSILIPCSVFFGTLLF